MNVQQRHFYRVYGLRSYTGYFPCNYRLHLWNIVEDSKCTYCNIVDTLKPLFCRMSGGQGILGVCKEMVSACSPICH